MRALALGFLAILPACGRAVSPPQEPAPVVSPEPEPPEPPPEPTGSEGSCAVDADCVLATRASLGCCDPCPTVEAMSVAERDEIADLCGLHQGGETCPPMEELECPAEGPPPARAVCRDGSCRAETASPDASTAPADPSQVESLDVLSREPVTDVSEVLHILVGWAGLPNTDPRAASRTREEAGRRALELLAEVRAGADVKALMAEHSEDPGSAPTGSSYTVRPTGDFVPEFEALSLRLHPGEAGICATRFGYHVIQRLP